MRPIATLAVAAALLTLAACGGSDEEAGADAAPTTSSPATSSPATSATSPSSASGEQLTTADTSLGTIVVDGSGRTVYLYDKDTRGATSSACTGGCAQAWPAVSAASAGAGITGEVGSITGVDGAPQATLDGWPLYYYAEDAAAGDVTGQGVGGIWWVLGPDGSRIADDKGATSGNDSPSDAADDHGGSSGADSSSDMHDDNGGRGDY